MSGGTSSETYLHLHPSSYAGMIWNMKKFEFTGIPLIHAGEKTYKTVCIYCIVWAWCVYRVWNEPCWVQHCVCVVRARRVKCIAVYPADVVWSAGVTFAWPLVRLFALSTWAGSPIGPAVHGGVCGIWPLYTGGHCITQPSVVMATIARQNWDGSQCFSGCSGATWRFVKVLSPSIMP